MVAPGAFADRVSRVLARYFRQNGHTEPAAETRQKIADRLWVLIEERGLPRPLRPEERGAPGEMAESESTPLVERVVAGETDPLLTEAARQLVKACFYPEFKTCRDSFRELSAKNHCRRQELARVRKRISGSHCVDCPYWQTLSPEQHMRFLADNWQAGRADFDANCSVFLPEDFRALRQWVRATADEAERPGLDKPV